MTRDDLAQTSRDELIEKVLADHAKLQEHQVEIEALKLKMEMGKKPSTSIYLPFQSNVTIS